MRRAFLLLLTLLALAILVWGVPVLYYAATASRTTDALHAAAQAPDKEAFERMVDLPAVRASLKKAAHYQLLRMYTIQETPSEATRGPTMFRVSPTAEIKARAMDAKLTAAVNAWVTMGVVRESVLRYRLAEPGKAGPPLVFSDRGPPHAMMFESGHNRIVAFYSRASLDAALVKATAGTSPLTLEITRQGLFSPWLLTGMRVPPQGLLKGLQVAEWLR